jgi:hypothetical protein
MSDESLRVPEMRLTFEKVWGMFQETALQMKETDRQIKKMRLETDRRIEEADRQMKEMRLETDRRIKETDRQMKETDRKINKLGSRIGDLVEEMIFPNIIGKFNKLGYVFGKAASNVWYSDAQGRIIAEVDILLENGEVVLAVEVKTNLTPSHVWEHIKRMEKLRRYADSHQDSRKLLGAVAGAIASEEAKALAVEKGFFVLEQSGDTIRISVPAGFQPKIW